MVEDGPGGRPALFRAAQSVLVAQTAAEVPALLAELDKARAKGFWVAGYLSYEAGYALEPKLAAKEPEGGGPRAVFGVFAGPEDGATLLDTAAAEARGVQIAPVEPMISVLPGSFLSAESSPSGLLCRFR